jgi:hypothetical protein
MKKIILHLCADIGSDSRFYQLSSDYDVILVGEKIGVQNFKPPKNVYGVIANPVCTDFSTAKGFHKGNDIGKGMFLVNHCLRIIDECKPFFHVLENPFNGRLKDIFGKPDFVYQPWQFGSPWTKKTALWGKFNTPKITHQKWEDVQKNNNLYLRPGRGKPSLAFNHKSHINFIEEFSWAKDFIKTDADFRSLCSQGFAYEFFNANR